MNSADTLLAAMESWPQWLDFLAMAGALLLGVIGMLLWFVMFRKKKHRKKRRKRQEHEKRQLNPTLAETGGLPPIREEKKTDAPAPPP